jgi:hypothetical protein
MRVAPFGQPHDGPMRFYLWQDVLEELWFAAGYRERPSAALLTGLYGISEDGPFIEVTGFEGLDYFDELSDLTEVFKPMLEQNMQDRPTALSAAVPGPVGFFARAPGATIDEELARLHLTLFNVPYQVALLLDPEQEKIAVYTRQPRGRFFAAAFHLVSPNAASAVGEEQ